MSKDSVKKRLGSDEKRGCLSQNSHISLFRETDFLYLYIWTGMQSRWEDRISGEHCDWHRTDSPVKQEERPFALTCPLITKSDGSKFGKTESGKTFMARPWKNFAYHLLPVLGSMYPTKMHFFEYIKIFTLLGREEMKTWLRSITKCHERLLQKRLAEEVTMMVHSRSEARCRNEASQILFGKRDNGIIRKWAKTHSCRYWSVFPHLHKKGKLADGSLLLHSVPNNPRVLLQRESLGVWSREAGVSINKTKVEDPDQPVIADLLLNKKYLLIQKGRKTFIFWGCMITSIKSKTKPSSGLPPKGKSQTNLFPLGGNKKGGL